MRLCKEFLIHGIVLLVFYQGAYGITPADSSDACTEAKCRTDPCDDTGPKGKCPQHPDAICKANYCGGCFAEFYDASDNKLEDCGPPVGECRGDQVWKDCASPCTKTCDNQEPNCIEVCVERCECPDDTPLLKDWKKRTCVEASQCPEPETCKSNLVYNECGSGCIPPWRTCSAVKRETEAKKDRDPSDKDKTKDTSNRETTSPVICNKRCVGRCECPESEPVLYKGVCISEDACPEDPETCTDWVKCYDDPCNFNTCFNHPEAKCKPNFCGGCFAEFYDESGRKMEDCEDPVCEGGQTFNKCGSMCNSTCENPNPICTKGCMPRCECPTDRPILKLGECVASVDDCDSTVCSDGMEYKKCGSACPRTCKNLNPVCGDVCTPGCYCPDRAPVELKIRGQLTCVPENKCPDVEPDPECEGLQVFAECGCRFTATCRDRQPICTFECVKRCECPADAPIYHDNKCIAEADCPPDITECEGGQISQTCGMDCTRTCDDPKPRCNNIECVPDKCECPRSKPIWHDGECISLDRCPDQDCTDEQGNIYEVDQKWIPRPADDPCYECICKANYNTPEARADAYKKYRHCVSRRCTMPKCETQVIYPKDQCCPICADPCNFYKDPRNPDDPSNIVEYDVGDVWYPDPVNMCSKCTCLKSATSATGKEQQCKSKYNKCEKPDCDDKSEIVWPKDCNCPYCAEKECVPGDVWKGGSEKKGLKDCITCTCVEENGVRKADCTEPQTCPPPDPYCNPTFIDGECCPKCLPVPLPDECKYDYDDETKALKLTAEARKHSWYYWKEDICTECTCPLQQTSEPVCFTMECGFECSGEKVEVPDQCCPICLKPCYSVDRRTGELTLHNEGESWEKDPCTTCRCSKDGSSWRNDCFEKMCAIPNCIGSELVYDEDVCCPYCSVQCEYNEKVYKVNEVWQPDCFTTCTCENKGGRGVERCDRIELDCAPLPDSCKAVYYPGDACCPTCLGPCTTYNNETGEITEYGAEERWGDECTFCECTVKTTNAGSVKEETCSTVDCAPLQDSCVPFYKEGECCPTCASSSRESCTVEAYGDNSEAISMEVAGSDVIYTFECYPGYWLAEGSGDKAFCDRDGIAVYPSCEKVSIGTDLKEQGPDTYLVEVFYKRADRERRGILCDDGWSDREATLLCVQHGYKFGRAVSLVSFRDFLLTQMSCPRDDDYYLQHCSVTRYEDSKFPCQSHEVAGIRCYNGIFGYKTSKMIARSTKKTVSVSFEISAHKYGKKVDLKRGVFRLQPESIAIVTETTTLKPIKTRVRARKTDEVTTVRLKARKLQDYQKADCISVKIIGPSPEFDHVTDKYCF